MRRVERPLGMGVGRGRIDLLLPVLHLVQLLLQGTGCTVGHGCGARNHTDILVSQKKKHAIHQRLDSLVRWEGGAERGNTLPAGNVAVVIL